MIFSPEDPAFDALMIEAGVWEAEVVPPVAENPVRTRRFIFLKNLKTRPPDYLISGLIEKDSFGVLLGASQAGKSFVAVDIAACVGAGMDFHGKGTKKGIVVYMAGEGLPGLGRRFKAWGVHHGVEMGEIGVLIDTRPVPLIGSEEVLKAVIREFKPVLLIIDTLARFYTGSENDNSDMGKFIRSVDDVRRETGATALVIHHTGKDVSQGGRGANALYAASDYEYTLTRAGDVRTLANTKMKDGKKPKEMVFKFQHPEGQATPVFIPYVPTWADIESGISERDKIILEGVHLGQNQEKIKSMIQERLGLKKKPSNMTRWLNLLVNFNLVEKNRKALTTMGLQAIGAKKIQVEKKTPSE